MRPVRVLCASVLLTFAGLSRTVGAQTTTKTFIDYLQPTPITCSPLSSATWGVVAVLPRDLCNGIESAKGVGVPPDYFYWDGKIIRATDGTYHMFMSTWPDSAGFNPGWTGSESFHAVSDGGVLGPYQRQGYPFSNNGSHHGHNTSAAELQDGTYALFVSEVVPFTIYHSSSLDGPWTVCPNPTGELIQTNGVNAGTDTHWDSNVSLVSRPDGKFEIVQRHGLIALADTLCGPYLMQKPSYTYPPANLPSIDSIYPHRSSEPDPTITNPTHGYEEDPTIWYSGDRYHVLYDSATDRIGYHLSSPDGIHEWKDEGLAYDPRMYQKISGYVGSTVFTQWYKMERPGVVIENGHVTHVTWAVADVDKDTSIPAGSNHGSKIIVVPFDGVTFDQDTGGDGGASDSGGTASDGGLEGGASDATVLREAGGGDAAAGPSDATASSGSSSGGGGSGSTVGASGSSGAGAGSSSGTASTGASNGSSGNSSGNGSRNSGAAGSASLTQGPGGGGCGCVVGANVPGGAARGTLIAAVSVLLGARIRRRRSRDRLCDATMTDFRAR